MGCYIKTLEVYKDGEKSFIVDEYIEPYVWYNRAEARYMYETELHTLLANGWRTRPQRTAHEIADERREKARRVMWSVAKIPLRLLWLAGLLPMWTLEILLLACNLAMWVVCKTKLRDEFFLFDKYIKLTSKL